MRVTMSQWWTLGKRGEHLSDNFDVGWYRLLAGISQLTDVFLEELFLSVEVAVPVSRGETAWSVANFREYLLVVHNTNFINITNE